jgi:putative tricarboxylic transport membrane protein
MSVNNTNADSNRPMVNQKNIGSLIIATVFIFVAVLTLYDTTHYSDMDSKVFPRACATVLLIFSIVTVIWELIKPSNVDGFGSGYWWRRILLVTSMLMACLAMPYITFMPAGGIAFIGGLVAAMHDRWSKRTLLLYWGSGAVIVVAFYSIFKYVLYVPLP